MKPSALLRIPGILISGPEILMQFLYEYLSTRIAHGTGHTGKIVPVILLTLIAVAISTGCTSTTHVYETNKSDPHGCPAAYTYCSYKCTDLQTDTWNCGSCGNHCPMSGLCTNGSCSCEKGKTPCDNECTDLQTDTWNCGSCGHICSSDHCTNGHCMIKY